MCDHPYKMCDNPYNETKRVYNPCNKGFNKHQTHEQYAHNNTFNLYPLKQVELTISQIRDQHYNYSIDLLNANHDQKRLTNSDNFSKYNKG